LPFTQARFPNQVTSSKLRAPAGVPTAAPAAAIGASVGNPAATLATALLGFFVVTLDAVIVNVALPDIRADLGGGIRHWHERVQTIVATHERMATGERDVSAIAAAAGKDALATQIVKCRPNSIAADVQRVGQSALRRKPGTSGQRPVPHELA